MSSMNLRALKVFHCNGCCSAWRVGVRVAVLLLGVLAASTVNAQETEATIRVGMIGLDTSHAPAFATLLNAEAPKAELTGCRVVAAYPHGSPDIRSSVERVPEYTAAVSKLGVEIVDSIDALLGKVDAVLLMTNDGRPHFEQALPVLKSGKRMFIDKPMAGSLADVMAIFAAARKYETPIFSSSALRYGPGTQAVRSGSIGEVLGCNTYGPCSIEPTHPDLFWYGVHGVESLFTIMGTGCESVARTATQDTDVVVGKWRDGRIGVYRGMRNGTHQFGGTAFGTQGDAPVGDLAGYEPLVIEIVKFFRGANPPVSEEETVEMFAFMEAADESKKQAGQPVEIEKIMTQARQTAEERLAE